jgi:lysine/ornithine N-monooxygenase
MRPDWQMGQVAHLLSLSGHNVPEYSAEFMTAGNYAAKLENARTGMSIFPHIVSSIEKSQENKKYRIKTQDTIFSADKIIIATGSGPARQRENIKVSQETAEIETPYKKVISGSEYVKEGAVLAPLGSKIAIEGPSATAAWAYQKALLAGYSSGDIYWFTRNSNFDTAFPSGGRNRDIQETSKGNRYTGKLLTKGIIVGDKVHLFF